MRTQHAFVYKASPNGETVKLIKDKGVVIDEKLKSGNYKAPYYFDMFHKKNGVLGAYKWLSIITSLIRDANQYCVVSSIKGYKVSYKRKEFKSLVNQN